MQETFPKKKLTEWGMNGSYVTNLQVEQNVVEPAPT